MQEAWLYDHLAEGRVRCHLCCRRCVIAPGARGFCRTRENRDGVLYSLIADQVSSVCVDPIEKKPLYHFYPGSRVLSLGTVGCSFRCPGCQNWQISREAPGATGCRLTTLPPLEAVDLAVAQGADGVCWTYNDPAIWGEYTKPCAEAAKAHGLSTAYVTNGTATREHLDLVGPYLDAYRVDIKAFTSDAYRAVSGFGRVDEIFADVRYAKERWDMHIECVTNVTPTVNDHDDELGGIARWIVEALGPDTPWHVTRFFPFQALAHLPATPIETLARAVALGRRAGLRYIYTGNVAETGGQDTCCPACGTLVVARHGFRTEDRLLPGGRCPTCSAQIAGRFR